LEFVSRSISGGLEGVKAVSFGAGAASTSQQEKIAAIKMVGMIFMLSAACHL